MDFVTGSDTAATVASWVGGLLTAAGLACICLIFAIRTRTERAKQFSDAAMTRWQTTLFDAASLFETEDSTDSNLKAFGDTANRFLEENKHFERRDLPYLLFEWNYIHESLLGDSKKGLNFLAEKVDLPSLAIKALKSSSLERRLLAINTLGNLADQDAYSELEKILDDRDPVISSWAWRALFRIDESRTINEHLYMIARREDWSPIFIAHVLYAIGSDERSEPLCRLVEEHFSNGLGERQMSRLISYLSLAHVVDHSPIVNRILLKSDQTEVIIACLRLISSDDDLTKIRELIRDDRWEVRMQVVLTLGRLGHKEDIDRLLGRLDDTDWWVRYRTAGVLLSMPGMTNKKAHGLARNLPNQFARDILQQVLAETKLTCFPQTSLTLSR